MGLIKMDFLGLRNLGIIDHAIEDRSRTTAVSSSTIESIPLDDSDTYAAAGPRRHAGRLPARRRRRCGSCSSSMEPTHFDDIAAVLALYRPGPMAANAHTNYAQRKNGRQSIDPIHPEL